MKSFLEKLMTILSRQTQLQMIILWFVVYFILKKTNNKEQNLDYRSATGWNSFYAWQQNW